MGVDHPEKDGNLLSPDNLQYPPLVLSRGIFVSDKDRRPDDRRGDRSGGLSGKPGKIDLSGKNPDSSSPDKIPDNSHLDDVKENDELGTSKLQVPRLGKTDMQPLSGLQKDQFMDKLYNEIDLSKVDDAHETRFRKYYSEYGKYVSDRYRYDVSGWFWRCWEGFSRKSKEEEEMIDKMRIKVLAASLSNDYRRHQNLLESYYGTEKHDQINKYALLILDCSYGSEFGMSNDEYRALREDALYRAERDWMRRNPERVRKFQSHGSVRPDPQLDQPGR